MSQSLANRLKPWLTDPKNRALLIALGVMILIISFTSLFGGKQADETSVQEVSTADTYIPDGYVLLPIELQNADTLSSMIGEFAVVDLFQGPQSKRVGKRLKLLRAPLNPNQYAVLVPEGEVSTLMSSPGPYWAAIQNPNLRKGSSITQHSKKSRIEYYQGN